MDTTRQARQSSGPTPYTVGDTYFLGMDNRKDPERLDPGVMQSIQNMLPSGDGSVTSRAGFQGMLTTAHAGSVYSMTRWVSSGGTVYFVYAAVGKLWRVSKDGTSATEIKKTGAVSFAFTNNGRGVMMRRRGAYIYLIDSEDSSGSLYRLDMAGIIAGTAYATAVSGLAAPTEAPAVSTPSRRIIDPLSTSWGVDTGTYINTNLIGNSYFNGGDATGADVGNYWIIDGGTPECYTNATVTGLPTLPSAGDTWLHLDEPGTIINASLDSGGSTPYLTNGYATNSSWGTSSGFYRYCTRFLFRCRAVKVGNNSNFFTARIQFFSATPTTNLPVYEHDITITPSAVNKDDNIREYIDITDIVPGPILYIRLYLLPDPAHAGHTDGPYVTAVELQALHPEWTQSSNAFTPTTTDVAILRGLYLAATFNSTQDLSTIDTVGFDVSIYNAFVTPPAIEVKFTNSGGTIIWTSPPTTFDTFINVDITLMPVDLRGAVTNAAIVFLEDVALTNTLNGAAFYIPYFVNPGNLSPDTEYTYWYSFVDANGTVYDDGGIESSGSPLSSSVTTVNGRRCAQLTITRSGYPTGTDYLAIWRLGGTIPDGDSRAHLVAYVPINADASYPASTNTTYATNRWYWDYNTSGSVSTFYDNVPDSELSGEASYQEGRDLPITGATALAVHGDRIVLAKGGYVYLSWLIGDTESNGLYFTYNPDPDDPEVDTKGALLRVVGTGDSNKVVALQPLSLNRGDLIGSALAVMLSETPPSIITGFTGDITKADAFSVRPFPQEVGGGCLSWRSVMEAEGGVWYAAASGIVNATSDNLTRKSLALENALSLLSAGTTNYSQTAMLLHDARVWAFLPTIGGTTGTVYVLDNRIPADVGWVTLTGSIGFTGGLSLSGGGDTGDLYLAGMDGQIYKYTGTSDKATPAASATAIALSVKPRRHGQSSAQGTGVLGVSRPYQVSFESNVGATTAWTVTLENEYGQTHAKTWNVTATGRQEKTTVRGWHDLRGKVHSVRFQASVTAQTTLRNYLVFLTEGGEVR